MTNKTEVLDGSELERIRSFMADVVDKSSKGKDACVYRGEPACYPIVSSGLFRACPDSANEAFDIVRVEEEMVADARRYTGTAVWGVKSKDEKAQEPVRVENTWPALVSRETFDLVQQGLHERAPAKQRPAQVGSQYLLSGLLRCGVCGKPYSAQGAKTGQFAYYVCASLFREGAGACTTRYLNATKVEDLVIKKVRERILTEETITELVTLVAEEIDNLAGEVNGRLTAINSELSDVEGRLEFLELFPDGHPH